MNDLIEEEDIRKALQRLRPDRDAFEVEVRQRLNGLVQRRSELKEEVASPWLQVAASLMPLLLIGKASIAPAGVSIAKISFGYKLIGYLALPAMSVLFVLGAGLLALIQVWRTPLRRTIDSGMAEEQSMALLTTWWKTFGLVQLAFPCIAMVLYAMGYEFPLLILFLVSGLALATLVTRLGELGLIDRRILRSLMIPSLLGVAQVTQITVEYGNHLFDQMIVSIILYFTAIVIGYLALESKGGSRLAKVGGLSLLTVLLMGFFGWSTWYTTSISPMKRTVEAFDRAPYSSASWKEWSIPTVWLQESGVPLDLSQPRALLQKEISTEQNPFVLGVASRTGLLVPEDLSKINRPNDGLWLHPNTRGQAILSIGQFEHAIRGRMLVHRWEKGELDHLESRLLATIRRSIDLNTVNLEEALIATKILHDIGRPCRDADMRVRVQQTLVAMQRVSFHLGGRKGGFAAFPRLKHCDPNATVSAVELMAFYGVPKELSPIPLRSYLRPSFSSLFSERFPIRTATRMRWESLPDLPTVRWWEYLWYESSVATALWFAILCIFTMFRCPRPGSTVLTTFGEET